MYKHGHRRHEKTNPTYYAWTAMHQRCNNPNHSHFKDYGERGIKTCNAWKDFQVFFADMGPRPDGLTLERRNNNGNYEPNNCYWATYKEQNNNRRPRSGNKKKTELPKNVFKNGKNFKVQKYINKKYYYLGTFKTIEEAKEILK